MNTPEKLFEAMIVAMMDDADLLREVVIINATDAMPATFDMCDAFELGRLDAMDSKPCRPGQWERPTHQCEYMIGWRDAKYIEDTLDYEDDILDREYHARGMW